MRKILFITVVAGISCWSCSGAGGNEVNNNNSNALVATPSPITSLAEKASGNIEAYESSDVNEVEQARPTIMVIPGDLILEDFKCIKKERSNGREYILRDYKNYLLKDENAKQVISVIQDAFIEQNYPLNDFEQTLRQLDTQEAMDMADGLEKDARTMLCTTAQPDIILELTYSKPKVSLTGHNYKKSGGTTNYTLSAIDAYNNKVVATITANGVSGDNVVDAMQNDIKKQMPKFQNDIQKHFSDILTRGRDITVRIASEQGSGIKLTDESIEGDTYTDWIIDYIKTHTVKGSYKLQRNTDKELYFVNCRIKLINEDGTQYGVYDWGRDLQKNLRKNLGLKCANRAQGLGEVLITVQGIN